MRPLIGISTYREQARWGVWDVPAVLLPASYTDAVFAAGGEPVLLPTGSGTAEIVARLDGLVLAGGADVDPAHYGSTPGRTPSACGPTGTPPSSPSCRRRSPGTCRCSRSAAACSC